MAVRIQLRRDTAANWTSSNPTLTQGEVGIETDTGKFKIGNGTTVWSSLPYVPGSQLTGYPLTNADLGTNAAIAHSKLANITAGSVLLGNASNVPTATALSGDVTVTSSGVTTVVSGSTSTAGKLQLTDTTSSTSTTTAATPNSVKSAYDLANAALPKAGGTVTGDVTLDNQSDLRFGEATANGTNWVAFQGPANIAANVTWTLPSADGTTGQALITNGSGVLSWATAGGGSGFPAGTAMLFVQTNAPTGWTKSTTHNDKALRVVSGSASSGGSSGFSTVFNGSVGSTTLTTSQIPSHTHTYDKASGTGGFASASVNFSSFTSTNTGATGGGDSHTHSMNVAYVDVIIATKD